MQLFFQYKTLFFILLAIPVHSQIDDKKLYRTDNASSIYLPLGNISFADSVVDFKMGKPEPYKKFSNKYNCLHEPNYTTYSSATYLSLGCKGSLTVSFTDNGFMNLPGYDLYIFEVGPSRESAKIEISTNGKIWHYAGTIAGGKSAIDLSDETIPEDIVYYYVRITDLKEVCNSKTAGADIDAIGAINSVIKLHINADVLFDVDHYTLKKSANFLLDSLASTIQQVSKASILVEGHTDDDGSEDYNLELSKNRSYSVAQRLHEKLNDSINYTYDIRYYGESKPKVENSSAINKQLNRRVEIIVYPPKDYYDSLLKEN